MSSSLVKFANRTSSGANKLFWHRSDVDGLPFRGQYAPMMPEEEYESRVVRVADFRNGFFDIEDTEQNKQYCEIMDCIANGWFQLRHQIFFHNNTTKHYVEWIEYYMEDGTRTPFQNTSTMELAHGQQPLLGNLGG